MELARHAEADNNLEYWLTRKFVIANIFGFDYAISKVTSFQFNELKQGVSKEIFVQIEECNWWYGSW